MNTEQTIAAAGYRYSRTCHCEGFKTKVYISGLYELKWRTTKYQFKIKRNGTTLINWTNLSELESKILEVTV